MKYDHTAFIVRNIEKSIIWYKEKFKARVIYESNDWALISIYGTKLALSTGKHPFHIAFKTNKEMLNSYGEEKIHAHRDGTESIYFEDLDGNAVELIVYPDAS
tara:strand:+ start:1312 stop:1620 length:309 start_codon:yes stop_codon:yes gene_type:complete